MGRAGSYIAYILAVVIGYWLIIRFSPSLSTMITPLFGENAMMVAIIALMASPFLVAFAVLRLLD